jgi:serine/threonine-protein kinase
MPAEQLHGAVLDGRADVYALGCILFELLAGQSLHPLGRGAIPSTLAGADARPSARRPELDIPPELDAICVRATARLAADRYPSARALYEALERYLAGDRDLERRGELTARHLDAAVAALDGGDAIESRRHAMREAGRALALRPDDGRAAALVTRLLLEPPPTVPVEVERDLAAARERRARDLVRMIVTTYLSYVLFVPLVVWMGVRDWAEVVGFVGLWAIATFTAVHFARRGVPRWGPWALMLVSTCILVLVGRIFGVLVIAPLLAVSGAAVISLHPYAPARVAIIVIYATAALGPLVLEQAGVLPQTFRFLGDHVEVTSQAVGFPRLASTITLAGMVMAALLLMTRLTGRARALLEEDARRRALSAWQLAQLVGGEPPAPVTSGTRPSARAAPADRA